MYKLLYKLTKNRWLQAIRMGFLKIQSIVIIGCLTTVMLNLPIEKYNELMIRIAGSNWKVLFSMIQRYTLGIITIPLILTISHSLASIKDTKKNKNELNSIISAVVSFIIVISITSDMKVIDISSLGAGGMAFGVLISLLSSEIFLYFSNLLYREKKNTDYSNDSTLNDSIGSLIPAALTIILFFSLKIILERNGVHDIFHLWNGIFNSVILFFNKFIPTMIIYVLGVHVFWFLGIHGSNIFDILNTNFFDKNLELNKLAVLEGITATEIFTKQFFDTFVNIGGSGATLCLIIAIFITKTNSNNRNIAKLAVVPGIFNINEIVIYGIAIIFNPAYIIPFILTPLVFTFTSYVAMGVGMVPVTVNEINWITPIFLNAYLSTGSINAILLQIFNISLGVMIYRPFVELSNKIQINESQSTFEELKKEIYNDNKIHKYLTTKNDSIGSMARGLGNDLASDLHRDKNLYLEYQPQVNRFGKVVGVEALLRWKHEVLGNIPPNIIITISQEMDMIDELGMWIIDRACNQLHMWNKKGIKDMAMSINISTLQLKNPKFAKRVKDIIEKYELRSSDIKLEITENLAISDDRITGKQLKEIENYGIKLAIDDFGQGYNPILYIQKYNIDIIKLDGSLIKNIAKDKTSRNIVKSMYSLCQDSGIIMVAEFVETMEQKEILDKLGNCIYQGYLFSKPLSGTDCLEYIIKTNKSPNESK
ncbi:MAG: PTS sugar transporter subunit IIC/EAL domain-containing protein [Fusobacteriaceae bacterium]